MRCSAGRSCLFVRAERSTDALRVPGLPRRRGRAGGKVCEIACHVALDVRVGTWIAGLGVAWCAGVIDVVGGLLPGIEYHLVESVVRVQWTTPGILEALIPGRMQGHGGTEEVPG